MKSADLDQLTKAQQQQFKYVAFSGGGAKGAIYSGVHETLEKTGILVGVEAVAGSSAGAITAALVASGMQAADFKHIAQTEDLKGLVGKGVVINHDGNPLYELLQAKLPLAIEKYLQTHDVATVCQQRLEKIDRQLETLRSSPDTDAEIAQLQSKQKQLLDLVNAEYQQVSQLTSKVLLTKEIAGADHKQVSDLSEQIKQQQAQLTFGDLQLMHLLAPEQFKQLVITATNKSTGELTIFDSHNTPNVEIALACRASASIPVYFKPVEINSQQYVDGGYRDNIPQKYFNTKGEAIIDSRHAVEIQRIDDKDELQQIKQQQRTLALAFGSNEPDSTAHCAIYSAKEKIVDPGKIMKFLMDVIFKIIAGVGGKFKYSESENIVYDHLRKNALNAVLLDTKEVGTLSFEEAKNQADYLHIKGAMQTARHLDNHFIAVDSNLDFKETILEVYERAFASLNTKSIVGKFTEKISNSIDKKTKVELKHLLDFCQDDKWHGQDPAKITKNFIIECSSGPNSKLLSESLAATLNSTTIPLKVKGKFMQAIGVKKQTIASPQAVIKYQFLADKFKIPSIAQSKLIKARDSSYQEQLKHEVSTAVKQR